MKTLSQILQEFKDKNLGASDEGIDYLRKEITDLIKEIFAERAKQEAHFGIESIEDYWKAIKDGYDARSQELIEKLNKALE